MSTSKYSISNIGPHELLTLANSGLLGYTYYELNKLGADTNKKIATVSKIVKHLNNNINVIHQHFIKHLYHHKTILDVDDQLSSDDNSENINLYSMNEDILMRIKTLEDRILELESIKNSTKSCYSNNENTNNQVKKCSYDGSNTEKIF
jgi:hypothetical protein